MFVRWSFFDPYTNETYTFPVNGYEGGDTAIRKNVGSTPTTAPDGRRIFYEGLRPPQEGSVKGRIRSASARAALVAWARKPYQVLWTNDLGEQRWIRITGFAPERRRVSSRPYKADYTLRFVLFGRGSVPTDSAGPDASFDDDTIDGGAPDAIFQDALDGGNA